MLREICAIIVLREMCMCSKIRSERDFGSVRAVALRSRCYVAYKCSKREGGKRERERWKYVCVCIYVYVKRGDKECNHIHDPAEENRLLISETCDDTNENGGNMRALHLPIYMVQRAQY